MMDRNSEKLDHFIAKTTWSQSGYEKNPPVGEGPLRVISFPHTQDVFKLIETLTVTLSVPSGMGKVSSLIF
jgi:hypothetical protein